MCSRLRHAHVRSRLRNAHVRTRLRNVVAFVAMVAGGAAAAQQRIVLDLPLPPPSAVRAAAPAEQPAADASVSVDAADSAAAPAQDAAPQSASRLLLSLQPGESLYHLFSRHQLSQADLVGMVSDRRIKARLRRLRAGQRLAVHAGPDGKVQRVYLQMSGPRDQLIERAASGFRLREIPDADDFISTPAAAESAAQLAEAAPARDEWASSEPEAPPQRVRGAVIAAAQGHGDGAATAAPDPVPDTAAAPDRAHAQMQTVTVKPGDSLYLIFKRAGVPPQDLARLLDADEEAQRLRRLRPGQEVALLMSEEGQLHELTVALDPTRTLRAARAGQSFTVAVEHEPLERRTASASAVIEDAVFLAGQREGLSDRLIMELIEIFGWDVDFALDVRAGDHFTVLYEELYKDGEKVGDGHILASEFVNRGRAVRAVRFVDDTGRASYYTPEGLSMRKAFLRTPVKFSRISSRFSRGRMHPVLQRMRAHKGVDYAAPTGTPVRAAGDGRVQFAGWKGGYGRAVILQHGSTYTTLYGHLSKLHKGVRNGARVQQGAIIGYVGQTGLATGPHLHYEFRVRGEHQDPLRVKLPKALPIEARYKREFLRESAPLVAQLDRLARTRIASRD